MIAASHKRVLENVCNNDDDTIAKDFLWEVDQGGAHVVVESPTNLESQCCDIVGDLQKRLKVEDQKLIGKSEHTWKKYHHAHKGKKPNLDIIGES
jgi:hypothetical protein